MTAPRTSIADAIASAVSKPSAMVPALRSTGEVSEIVRRREVRGEREAEDAIPKHHRKDRREREPPDAHGDRERYRSRDGDHRSFGPVEHGSALDPVRARGAGHDLNLHSAEGDGGAVAAGAVNDRRSGR